MTHQRYPTDPLVTYQKFKESGWKEGLGNVSREGYSAMWHGLGREHPAAIAQKLNTLAVEVERDGHLHRSREFFDVASHWFNRSGDEAKSASITVSVAEVT